MPITLYKRQKQILEFIRQYIDKYSYSPTLGEIAEAIGVSSLATVHEHIGTLAKKGVIKRFDGAIRGIEVLDQNIKVGPTMVTGKKRSYVLQVKGDSMIEEGTLDGDYVIIEEQNTAADGDIVVALLDNGLATLKRFFKEKDRIRLEPANSSMSPIYATDVKIQGKCVGVIRRFQ